MRHHRTDTLLLTGLSVGQLFLLIGLFAGVDASLQEYASTLRRWAGTNWLKLGWPIVHVDVSTSYHGGHARDGKPNTSSNVRGSVLPSAQCVRDMQCSARTCRPLAILPPATFVAAMRNHHVQFWGDSVSAQLECDLRDRLLRAVGQHQGVTDYHSLGIYPTLNASVSYLAVGCPWGCRRMNNMSVEMPREHARELLPLRAVSDKKLLSWHASRATHIVFNIGAHYEDVGAAAFAASLKSFEALFAQVCMRSHSRSCSQSIPLFIDWFARSLLSALPQVNIVAPYHHIVVSVYIAVNSSDRCVRGSLSGPRVSRTSPRKTVTTTHTWAHPGRQPCEVAETNLDPAAWHAPRQTISTSPKLRSDDLRRASALIMSISSG